MVYLAICDHNQAIQEFVVGFRTIFIQYYSIIDMVQSIANCTTESIIMKIKVLLFTVHCSNKQGEEEDGP